MHKGGQVLGEGNSVSGAAVVVVVVVVRSSLRRASVALVWSVGGRGATWIHQDWLQQLLQSPPPPCPVCAFSRDNERDL